MSNLTKCLKHGEMFSASGSCSRADCDFSDWEVVKPRRVVWFSCGAASAVAAKLVTEAHPDAEVVYCDTSINEHPDNIRFGRDVGRWIGKDITVIGSTKYKTIEDVFEARKYMSGPKGAICTTELKKVPRFAFQQPDDIHIFGFTADEGKRIKSFMERNPELNLEWPLLDAGITKQDCYDRIRAAGIVIPAMYGLGFKNNNCLGCVKATSPAYWNRVRNYFPEVYRLRAEQSRAIGCKLVRYKGERIFLDQLPTDPRLVFETPSEEENVSCGPECGQVNSEVDES